jgi:hypothetical protein
MDTISNLLGFRISGVSDLVYISDVPNQNLETGSINIFKLNSPTQPQIVRRNVGTIDYIKGEIKLFPINIISTQVKQRYTYY